MNKDKFPQETINTIIKQGFKVYMRDTDDSYAYIESEDGICYIQHSRITGYSITTVHKPNKSTGTGYGLYSDVGRVTPKMLNEAIRTRYPHWDYGAPSVSKYTSMEHYTKGSKFNTIYKQVHRDDVPIHFP